MSHSDSLDRVLRTKPSQIVLSVDPGARFGAALWIRGRLSTVAGGRQTVEEVVRMINGVLVVGKNIQHEPLIVVEAQYMLVDQKRGRSRRGMNPRAISQLIRRAHEWSVVAQIREVDEADPVSPTSWQTVLREAPRAKTTKARSLAMARSMFPDHQIVDDHVADAVCLGLWYVRRQAAEHWSCRS